ncbi:MAG: hypothetical protein IJW79_00630 [Clostridia bacterium]|nr:hypothetical protein [Clostridia bacterium]
MKNFSKILSLLLVLALCVPFASCANADKETAKKTYLGVTDYVIGSDDVLRLNAETPQESLDALAVGDTVVLGKYDLDNNSENGEEDITWKVLDIEDGKALIISELCIDATSYSTEKNDVTWETSALRQKFNFGEESLYETVFADDEKAYILLSEVANEDNASHDVDGGNATEDYLFALSIDETEKYFDSDDARIAKASAKAVANGGQCFDSRPENETDPEDADEYMALSWWLRSPGSSKQHASVVLYFGRLEPAGVRGDLSVRGVRPAMWVKTVNEIVPEKIYTPDDWAGVKVGEKISLGAYEQDGDVASAEEIIWTVLSTDGSKATLISEKILERVLYYDFEYSTATNAGEVDWENSDLRKWLNGDFKAAFTDAELALMVETTLENTSHELTGAGGGAETTDLVYVLSEKELEVLIPDVADRMIRPTVAAEENGVYVDAHTRCGDWWLRDSGDTANKAKNVLYYGAVDNAGKLVKNDYVGVRPVITVDLTK